MIDLNLIDSDRFRDAYQHTVLGPGLHLEFRVSVVKIYRPGCTVHLFVDGVFQPFDYSCNSLAEAKQWIADYLTNYSPAP